MTLYSKEDTIVRLCQMLRDANDADTNQAMSWQEPRMANQEDLFDDDDSDAMRDRLEASYIEAGGPTGFQGWSAVLDGLIDELEEEYDAEREGDYAGSIGHQIDMEA